MLIGLAVAVAVGLLFAVAMHLNRALREAAYPLLVASQAIPIVVLAPIFVLAFDYGIGPKIAIVALICFFPITVNVLDGLRAVDPGHLKLMRSFGASRLRTLRSVELPAALPSFFSGLRIAASVSVIGAVFGEWAGADEGLGRLVLRGNDELADSARLRGHPDPHPHGRGAVLTRLARRAPGLPLEPRRKDRMTLRSLPRCWRSAPLGLTACGEKEDALGPDERGRASR